MRIPRDWFGPKDELVPIGPGAGEAAGDGSLDDPGAALPAAESLSANLFWGEDAGAVHDVVDAPTEPRAVKRRRAPMLVAVAAVVATVLAGTVISVLAGSQHRALRPLVAALPHRQYVSPARQSPARPKAKTLRRRPRVLARGRAAHRSAVAATTTTTTTTTSLAYHPDQARASTSVSYAPSQTSGPRVVQIPSSRSAGPTTAASTASPSQSAQPAFGSSGALGPMSTPDG